MADQCGECLATEERTLHGDGDYSKSSPANGPKRSVSLEWKFSWIARGSRDPRADPSEFVGHAAD